VLAVCGEGTGRLEGRFLAILQLPLLASRRYHGNDRPYSVGSRWPRQTSGVTVLLHCSILLRASTVVGWVEYSLGFTIDGGLAIGIYGASLV